MIVQLPEPSIVPINRTKVELKLQDSQYPTQRHHDGVYQSYQSGIETRVKFHRCHLRRSINRTKVELKHCYRRVIIEHQPTINRTKVELKQPYLHPVQWILIPINRTKVELKPIVCIVVNDSAQQLSIVPKWN